MKLTKSKLKEIIREVIAEVKEKGLNEKSTSRVKFSPKKAADISTQQFSANKQIIRKMTADADAHPYATDASGEYLNRPGGTRSQKDIQKAKKAKKAQKAKKKNK